MTWRCHRGANLILPIELRLPGGVRALDVAVGALCSTTCLFVVVAGGLTACLFREAVALDADEKKHVFWQWVNRRVAVAWVVVIGYYGPNVSQLAAKVVAVASTSQQAVAVASMVCVGGCVAILAAIARMCKKVNNAVDGIVIDTAIAATTTAPHRVDPRGPVLSAAIAALVLLVEGSRDRVAIASRLVVVEEGAADHEEQRAREGAARQVGRRHWRTSTSAGSPRGRPRSHRRG